MGVKRPVVLGKVRRSGLYRSHGRFEFLLTTEVCSFTCFSITLFI